MRGSLPLRCLAELLGTATLVGIGTGAIVEGAKSGSTGISVLAVAWFVAVALPVLAFASRSGAHLNPAVTAALALGRRFPARESIPYVGSQVAGAFLGSGSVWGLVGNGAHLGATVPRGISWEGVFVLEFGFTALLLLSVIVLSDLGRDPAWPELLLPAGVVGLSTYLIGPWTGSSLNPARSLAPGVLSGALTGFVVYVLAAGSAAALVGLAVRRKARTGSRTPSAVAPRSIESPGASGPPAGRPPGNSRSR